jgi:hypothetical protein
MRGYRVHAFDVYSGEQRADFRWKRISKRPVQRRVVEGDLEAKGDLIKTEAAKAQSNA